MKESLYTLLLERLEEAKISEAAVVGNAAIVDPATVPQSPVKPNKNLSLAIGGVLGIFLGMLKWSSLPNIWTRLSRPRKKSRDSVDNLLSVEFQTLKAQEKKCMLRKT